jgi:hypothetical protein
VELRSSGPGGIIGAASVTHHATGIFVSSGNKSHRDFAVALCAAPIAAARHAAILRFGIFELRGGNIMRIAAVMVLAFATAVPAAAQAAPVDVLFQQFGLFGTWALDCGRTASPANPHVSITTPSPGLVVENHDLGRDYAVNHYSVLSAERLSDDRLSVEVIFQPGTETEERQKLVFLVRDRTRRTMFNQPADGAVRVKDGVALAHGSKTPVLRKCD